MISTQALLRLPAVELLQQIEQGGRLIASELHARHQQLVVVDHRHVLGSALHRQVHAGLAEERLVLLPTVHLTELPAS